MKKHKTLVKFISAVVIFSGMLLTPFTGKAATSTSNLAVTLTVTANCTISATSLPFGTTSSLATVLNQTGSLGVTCTNTTPYTVGLDGGNVVASTVAIRLMAGTSTGNTTTTVPYQLYADAARTTIWGNTTGAWMAGVGNGGTQTLTVYGQVPVAAITPKPDLYSSTVVATITF